MTVRKLDGVHLAAVSQTMKRVKARKRGAEYSMSLVVLNLKKAYNIIPLKCYNSSLSVFVRLEPIINNTRPMWIILFWFNLYTITDVFPKHHYVLGYEIVYLIRPSQSPDKL